MAVKRRTAVVAVLAATLVLAGSAEASFPGGNGKVAFARDAAGDVAVYTVEPDGSSPAKLVDSYARDDAPAWSPDGSRIAFRRTHGADAATVVARADGGDQTVLPFFQSFASAPAWSSEGARVLFSGWPEQHFGLYAAVADGTGWSEVTPLGADPTGAPSWSPDGTRVAYAVQSRIVVADADDGNVRTITDASAGSAAAPDWSPDGTRIAFAADGAIASVLPDGADVTRLTDGTRGDSAPSWSPDGSRIAFARGGDIWVMNSDGTGQLPLTSGPDVDGDPSWQPLPNPPAFSGTRAELAAVRSALLPKRAQLQSKQARLYLDHARSDLAWALRAERWSPGGALAVNAAGLTGFRALRTALGRLAWASRELEGATAAEQSDLIGLAQRIAHARLAEVEAAQGAAAVAQVRRLLSLADADRNRVRATLSYLEAWRRLLRIDLPSLETTITAGPTGTVSSRSATFAFSSAEAGSTIECRLDSESFAPCLSPKTYAGLANGQHSFLVRAVDARGNVDLTPAVRSWMVAGPAGPTNDAFADAQVLQGPSGSVGGSNVGATTEPGEASWQMKSIWYAWTAPASGMTTIDTAGSDFQTDIEVYTGPAISSLTHVVGAGSSWLLGGFARLRFDARAGTTYRILVDSADYGAGWVSLNWILGPASGLTNDAFVDAVSLAGESGAIDGTNIGATSEPGEPAIDGYPGGPSVWFSWTAPRDATATFDTSGSRFDTMIGVYSGSSLSALTTVAVADDLILGSRSTEPLARVSFHVAKGVTYRILVDGQNDASGDLRLTWKLGPSNDLREQAQVLSGASGTVGGTNVGATKDIGEENHAGNQGGASIWYAWTAPASGWFAFAAPDHLLAVYQGADPWWVTHVADSPSGSVAFPVTAGVTYRIAVDSYYSEMMGAAAGGPVTLTWRPSAPATPANDTFSSAEVVNSGWPGASGTTVGATQEPGEPSHGYNAGGKSIWFSWTATADGPVTFNTMGSGVATWMNVYTGTSVSTLTLVAQGYSQDWSWVTFTAKAGITYKIAVDSDAGTAGSIALSIS